MPVADGAVAGSDVPPGVAVAAPGMTMGPDGMYYYAPGYYPPSADGSVPGYMDAAGVFVPGPAGVDGTSWRR